MLFLWNQYFWAAFIQVLYPVMASIYETEWNCKLRVSKFLKVIEWKFWIYSKMEHYVHCIFCGSWPHKNLMHVINHSFLLNFTFNFLTPIDIVRDKSFWKWWPYNSCHWKRRVVLVVKIFKCRDKHFWSFSYSLKSFIKLFLRFLVYSNWWQKNKFFYILWIFWSIITNQIAPKTVSCKIKIS